jgi:hypothetical protein
VIDAADILSRPSTPPSTRRCCGPISPGLPSVAFHELNPRTDFATNWHVRVIAAKLTAVHQGKIRRLIVSKA